MKNYSKVLIIAILGITTLTFSGCSFPANEQSVQEKEQKTVEQNQLSLLDRVPAPQLDTSLERINIKRRLELFNNESKISYIYLIDYGRVVAFYVVEGKISSGSKRLTTNQKIEKACSGYCESARVVENPSLDGTYGHSDSYVFFWTTEGVYVQWGGNYLLSDEPLKVTISPALVKEIK